MDTSNEINVDSFPKNEISQEEKEGSHHEKDKENEKDKPEEEVAPLSVNQLEVFELYNEKIKKTCGEKCRKNLCVLYILIFLILISLVFLYFFNKFRKEYSQLIEVNNHTPSRIEEIEINSSINTTNITKNAKIINETKVTEVTAKIINPVKVKNVTQIKTIQNRTNIIIAKNFSKPLNLNQTKQILTKSKITVGFLSPTITPFMISTGEYFLKSQKYNVVFLTKPPSPKDLKYNNNIKRINAYYNHILIQNSCKNENINFLIVNEDLAKNEINWLKSLGIKVIGVLDDISITIPQKRTLVSKNAEFFDAFIQKTPEDYKLLKKLKTNIYIPKFTSESKLSNLDTNNIVLRTELTDKNNGLTSIISTLPLVMKDVPNAKLNIISSDKPTKEINDLIKKLQLTTKNINFISLNEKSTIYPTSSIFIYGALNQVCPIELNEAKAHGLPCIISSEVQNIEHLNSGIIKVDISNNNLLAKEIVKLLKDNIYRKKMGKEATLSLVKSNDEVLKLWERLFVSLKNGEKDFENLRKEVEKQYSKKDISKKKSKKKKHKKSKY